MALDEEDPGEYHSMFFRVTFFRCLEENNAEVEVNTTMLEKSDKKSMEMDEENQGNLFKTHLILWNQSWIAFFRVQKGMMLK